MKKYLFFSALLHIIIFLGFFALNKKNSENFTKNAAQTAELSGENKSTRVEIIERHEENSEEVSLDNNELGDESSSKDKKECVLFFGGIGIQQDFMTLRLEVVYKGYPADKAGLMIGDVVEPENGEDIRGEIGTSINVKVTRNGDVFYLTLVREKICYDDI
jgi:hypothetical protein